MFGTRVPTSLKLTESWREHSAATAIVALVLALAPAPLCASDEVADKKQRDLALIATLEDQRTLGRTTLLDFVVDPRVEVRRRAVRALGRLQDDKGRDAVTTALGDADVSVRLEAAFALGQLPSVRGNSLLEAFADATNPSVKVALVDALGKRGDGRHVVFLTGLCDKGAPALRAAALNAVGLIARRTSGRLSDFPAAKLRDWIGDADVEIRRAAAYVLMRWTKGVDEALPQAARRGLGDTDETVRARCARSLGDRGDGSLDAIQKATTDVSWRVRVEAVRAFGHLKASEALAAYLTTIAEQLVAGVGFDPLTADLHPVVAALDAALALEDPRPFETAAKTLHQAAKPSAKIGDGEGGARALAFSHLHCRAAALLDRRTGRIKLTRRCGASDFPEALREQIAVRVLAAQSKKTRVRALSKLYAAGTPQGKVAVTEALADLPGDPAGHALILKALEDTDPAVVAQAAEVSSRLKLHDAAGLLIAAYGRFMTANELETVQAIFDALGALKEPAAAPFLEEHVFHPNAAIRQSAVEALKAIKGHEARFASRMPVATAGDLIEPNLSLIQRPEDKTATISTSKGSIELEFFGDQAPLTVKNFVRLANKGFYNNLLFHRVAPNFVVQGGDPRGDGWGGPNYTIRCEVHPGRFERGTVGMALAGKDTGGSQFFVMHGPEPHLDGGYTAFARVVEGLEVADALTIGDRIIEVSIGR